LFIYHKYQQNIETCFYIYNRAATLLCQKELSVCLCAWVGSVFFSIKRCLSHMGI